MYAYVMHVCEKDTQVVQARPRGRDRVRGDKGDNLRMRTLLKEVPGPSVCFLWREPLFFVCVRMPKSFASHRVDRFDKATRGLRAQLRTLKRIDYD